MKFISKKNFIPLALAGAMALGSAALCAGVPARTASAAEETQAVHTQALPQEEGVMPLGYCTTAGIFKPDGDWDGITHNVFSAYKLTRKDPHASQIRGFSGASDRYPIFTYDLNLNASKNYVMVAQTNENIPQPYAFVIRAHCTGCNVSGYGIQPFLRVYSYARSYYNSKTSKLSGTIPTSYDQSENLWEHGGGGTNIICFSIAYNGEVKDGEVQIPRLWGTNEIKLTVGGVEFGVRTGPNKVSVKANQSVKCNTYDTMFAFVVKVKTEVIKFHNEV